jgi:hypothetical protein
MGVVYQIVWAAKVILLGCNTFKLCTDSQGPWFVCGISGIYFSILVVATLVSHTCVPKPRKIDRLESDYLSCLEEGYVGNKQA